MCPQYSPKSLYLNESCQSFNKASANWPPYFSPTLFLSLDPFQYTTHDDYTTPIYLVRPVRLSSTFTHAPGRPNIHIRLGLSDLTNVDCRILLLLNSCRKKNGFRLKSCERTVYMISIMSCHLWVKDTCQPNHDKYCFKVTACKLFW